MKNINKIKKGLICTLLLVAFISPSCTDLEEDPSGRLEMDKFFNTEAEIISGWLRVYFHMPYNWNWMYSIQFLNKTFEGTDMACYPAKGGYGIDGGVHARWHRHEFLDTDTEVEEMWKQLYQGVGQCTYVIERMKQIDENIVFKEISKERVVADLRCYRAWMYKWLLDFFGNVVIVDDLSKETPVQSTRQELYEYLIKEITESIPDLPEKGDFEWYGHFTKGAANFLLAKLYLNSEVYTGTGEYQKCIDACNAVISSGNYKLDPNWDDPFKIEVRESEECIFALEYSEEARVTWGFTPTYFLPPGYVDALGINSDARWTNWFVTHQSFLDIFDKDHDLRYNQWLVDTVKGPEGEYLFGMHTRVGDTLVLDASIPGGMENADEFAGARCNKFELAQGSHFLTENDYPVFRYADLLLMKAEAIIRKEGSANLEAVNVANEVRERAFKANFETFGKYTTATLTLDELLNERGRELTYEPYRREDLIRFGKWGEARWEKPTTDPTDGSRELLPIPLAVRSANSNINQNPGY